MQTRCETTARHSVHPEGVWQFPVRKATVTLVGFKLRPGVAGAFFSLECVQALELSCLISSPCVATLLLIWK